MVTFTQTPFYTNLVTNSVTLWRYLDLYGGPAEQKYPNAQKTKQLINQRQEKEIK